MRIQKHPSLPLWLREDGAVCLPPCHKFPKFRWTFGSKNKHTGYMEVGFRGKLYYVHRLMGETYLPNPLNLPQIDHINRVRHDNRIFNIRWVDRKTQQGNQQKVDDALSRYGVRKCDNEKEYKAAYYDAHREEFKDKNVAYRAKQKALGKRERKCPDGKRHLLTDAEFNARFGSNQQIPLF